MISKKMALVILVVIAMVATVSAVSYWVYSNKVTVKVVPNHAYILTLTAPATVSSVESIVFTGSLTKDGLPVNYATIEVTDSWGWDIMSTAITDADGKFTCSWTPTEVTEYTFQARYWAP